MNNENDNNKKNIVPHLSIGIVAAFMLLACVIGLIIPLRPSESAIEQRLLASFPTLSAGTIADGSYFSDLDSWYSDSYPGRENLLAINNQIKSLYGIKMNETMVGSDVAVDEIPDIVSVNEVIVPSRDKAALDKPYRKPAETNRDHSEEEVKTVDLPTTTALEAEIASQIQQNLLVKNGAAYSRYYFNLSAVSNYIEALNNAADNLDGYADVYSILVPNQSGVMLSMDDMLGFGGSNQIEAIDYYYGMYNNKVKTVDTIKTLREHNDQYLYFKTDHHWTALGAYYVYRNFCKVKGIEPHDLSYYETITFDPFLGSFYSQLHNQEMYDNPDYVTAYIPHGTNELTYWTVNGGQVNWHVITDVSKWNRFSGYSCFVGGDKPLAIVENPEISDGSACLVIKESYGNCFIPFLVDHYQTVYIMDYRYTNENLISFIKNHNIQDLIMINNITIIGSNSVTSRIASLLRPQNVATEVDEVIEEAKPEDKADEDSQINSISADETVMEEAE